MRHENFTAKLTQEQAVDQWAKVTNEFNERREAYRFFQVRETNQRVQAIRMANKRRNK